MLIRSLIITLGFCILSFLSLAQEVYQVKTYEVKFLIKNAGITVEGSLEGLEAEVLFHPRKLANNKIVASIDPGTIQTGIKIRNNHLKRSDYFDVEHYPKISLSSLGFSKAAPDTILGRFVLTIKDVTREIKMPIHYIISGNSLRLDGTFTIDRLDFGLGKESFMLADEVEILLNASLERPKI
ncbi:MAG: YceI family protein [Cyclobacteriaceae bacterium]|jgi:polyisoprenoid-binding protein YceI